MIFKKNAFSYFVWIIFAMCTIAVFSFVGMLLAKAWGGPLIVTALGLVAGFFGVVLLISVLAGKISEKIYSKKADAMAEGKVKKRLIAEGIATVCILVAGILLRIYLLDYAGESAAYYDVAKVTQDQVNILVPVQNSVYYYLGLLRALFLVVGNQWIAGIWLQIVLQILSGIVLYFAVRKMAGVWVAMLSLTYVMLVPSSIRLSLNYGPDVLYFLLWSIGCLAVSDYLSESRTMHEKRVVFYEIRMWLYSILVGTLIGFLTYVDIAGVVLLAPVMMLPALYRESGRKLVWNFRMFISLSAAIGSFFGFLYLDGILSQVSFYGVLSAWLTTFEPEAPDMYLLLTSSTLEVVILLVFMVFNIFAFFRSKKQDRFTIWIFMIFSLSALYVLGITTSSMNGRNLLLVLMCISASTGFRELFRVVKVEEAIVNPVMSKEETASFYEAFAADGCTAQLSDKKPEFIENPLPLPKKHVKKTMDYAIVPQSVYMKYDIEVSDLDDFDV